MKGLNQFTCGTLFTFMIGMNTVCGGSSEGVPELNRESGFLEFTLTTEYQAEPALVRVLLPDHPDPVKRHPVLYILPVESGVKSEFGNGLIEAKKADIANRYRVICVYPSFNKAAPWYGNHPTNLNQRQEDYVVRALVPFIDGKFPTQPRKEGRWLIGFSKSAWGAFTLLFRHPDIFGYAAGWDGPLMLNGDNNGNDWGPMGLSANFGTKEAMQKSLPTKLAQENAGWLKDHPRLVLAPGRFWTSQTTQMHAHLEALGIPHVYRSDLTFPHRWDSGWFSPLVEELANIAKPPKTKPQGSTPVL